MKSAILDEYANPHKKKQADWETHGVAMYVDITVVYCRFMCVRHIYAKTSLQWVIFEDNLFVLYQWPVL